MDWIDLARKVVEEKQAQYDDSLSVLLDLTTASMLVEVHDALNEKNREKFASFTLLKAVEIGWQCGWKEVD